MKEILKREIISTHVFSLTIGNVLIAATLLLAAYVFIQLFALVLTRSIKKTPVTDGRQHSVIQLVKYFVWSVTFVFILQSLGVNITFLIASSAALLVGIGLGLQSILKDFIAGISLLVEGVISVNDVVEVDGLVVKVNEISLRTSKVTTRDDNVMIIPNHKFTEEKIINWTANRLPSRFTIEVGVDYSSNLHLVEQTLITAALTNTHTLNNDTYKPTVRLSKFGNSSIEFQLIFYSYNLFRIESVKSHIRFEIAKLFKEHNIVIPFNQLVVHHARE
ncbi:MAG: mechanosensitive ion channel [Chitinophagales bacterium]|nr:mechanosensitive ion channel [Chitinophagales bacterium]